MNYNLIFDLLYIVRYHDWLHVVRTNLFVVLLTFAYLGTFIHHVEIVAIYIAYIHITLAFGFLVNNYADREEDQRVGRPYLTNVSLQKVLFLIFTLSILIVTLPLYFKNVPIMVIVFLGLIMGVGYSVRPIRLKERSFLGIIIPVVSQHLPFIFFYFLLPDASLLVLYLFGWLIVEGLLIEIEQQIHDRERDTATHTHTFITTLSDHTIRQLILLLLFIFFAYMLIPLFWLQSAGIVITFFLFVLSSVAIQHARKSLFQLQ